MNRKLCIALGLGNLVLVGGVVAAYSTTSPDPILVQKLAVKAALQTAQFYAQRAAPSKTYMWARMGFNGRDGSKLSDYYGWPESSVTGEPSVVSKGYFSWVISVPIKATVKAKEWTDDMPARLFVTVSGISGDERGWVAESEPFPDSKDNPLGYSMETPRFLEAPLRKVDIRSLER